MNEYLLAIIVVAGVPMYVYVIARIMTSAIIRSYFEIKQEFSKKKEVT